MKLEVMLAGFILGICMIEVSAGGDAFAVNLSKWRTAHIYNYTYNYQRSCVCQAENQTYFSISVVNGTVEEVVYTHPDSGSRIPIAKEKQQWYPTLDQLFDRLSEAHAMNAARIEARYDAQYGYPIQIHIDYDRTLIDDDLDIQITDFRITD